MQKELIIGFTPYCNTCTSFVSIVVYLQMEQSVVLLFYISHYSLAGINPVHDGSVAENTTEQVNWYFSSAVVSSWKGLTFIICVLFPRYSIEIIVEKINICVLNTILSDIAWTSSWKRLIYVWWTRYINLFHDDFHAISWNIFLKGLICLTLIFIWNV